MKVFTEEERWALGELQWRVGETAASRSTEDTKRAYAIVTKMLAADTKMLAADKEGNGEAPINSPIAKRLRVLAKCVLPSFSTELLAIAEECERVDRLIEAAAIVMEATAETNGELGETTASQFWRDQARQLRGKP